MKSYLQIYQRSLNSIIISWATLQQFPEKIFDSETFIARFSQVEG